jgi:hypothetical protein
MFTDRFEGSAVHGANRPRLAFESRLAKVNPIKDDWSFVWDDALRFNIAYAIQDVHFGMLLVNNYNVYWTPEAMIFKHAIIQVAAVIEAVLHYDLKLVEDDPRVKDVLGKDWVWVDWKEIPLPGVALPAGQRAVTGLQRVVEKEQLDRNSKMQVLIRASRKVGIFDDQVGSELDELRKTRNRIHIKTLDGPECTYYTATMANDALDLLERYRKAALVWTVKHRGQDAQTSTATLDAKVTQLGAAVDEDIDFGPPRASSTPSLAVDDIVAHKTLGSGVVTRVEAGDVITVRFFADNSERRLMLPYAPMQKIDGRAIDDNIPF